LEASTGKKLVSISTNNLVGWFVPVILGKQEARIEGLRSRPALGKKQDPVLKTA
jgi:hypothetical protein